MSALTDEILRLNAKDYWVYFCPKPEGIRIIVSDHGRIIKSEYFLTIRYLEGIKLDHDLVFVGIIQGLEQQIEKYANDLPGRD